MDYGYGFDNETNDTFIIFADGEIMYFDEVPIIINNLIKTIMEVFK